MKIGFHTDAFNSTFFGFEKCLEWARKNGVRWIECGLLDGVSWIHGLGYFPHVALYEDPAVLQAKMDGYRVRFSQVDAAFPLSGKEGPVRGVAYVQKAIAWAKLIGCPRVDTTDGATKPPGYSDEEVLAITKQNYRQILEWADDYGVTIDVEPHGPYTINPEIMQRILDFSPRLMMNLDTGNTFIAGQDPVAFAKRFLGRISHVHIKDVSQALVDAMHGAESGIATSEVAIGDGVNAKNIEGVLDLLKKANWDGVLSIECQGTPTCIRRSVEWLRARIK
jgi:sugar phosphate isomerase/epimerase